MSSISPQKLEEIRTYIAQDEVLMAFDELETVLPPDADATLIPSLRAQFTQLKKDKIKGILSVQDFGIESNKIRDRFLELLNLLEDKKERSQLNLAEVLQQVLENQSIAIGKQHLVNCDRKEHDELFWSEFPEKFELKKPYQFYFITACSTQHPYSFTERIIYEVEDFFSKEDNEAVFYEHQLEARRSLHNKQIDRVSLVDLPLGMNTTLSICMREFQDYFNQRFEKEGLTLRKENGEFVLHCEQKLHYNYILLHFRLLDSDWKSFTPQYLDEIIKIFKKRTVGLPHFVFFFALTAKDFHLTPNPTIQTAIAALNQQYDEVFTVFETLKPIKKEDLVSWLDKYITSNQRSIDSILERFEKEALISPQVKQQWKQAELLNMSDSEWLQELIYILIKQI